MESSEGVSSSPSPPSPGVSPVQLSDCIEELLRLALTCFLDGTLEEGVDLSLSKDYCSRLLQQDHHLTEPSNPDGSDSSGIYGVPPYPLYKRLGWAIERCINNGNFVRALEPMAGIPEVEMLKRKESDWNQLVADIGSELINMLKVVEFELHVQEPFFSQLKAGLKTVEGRCSIGNYKRIAPDALLLFNKCLLLQVKHIKWYNSFEQMLEIETLPNVLPGVETIEEGVQIYRNFYSEEKEMSNGVLAISVSRPASQPYILIAKLLSGLGYVGVGGLLGMVHTAGTVPNGLPPPRSALISSFMSPHRPERLYPDQWSKGTGKTC